MSQLKALTKLYVGYNKLLPSTDVDFIIESFPQLIELGISDLGLTGEHSRSTNGPLTFVCSAAVHDRQSQSAQDALRGRQRPDRYVLL